MDFLAQDKLLFPEIIKNWPVDIHKKMRAKVLVIAGSREMVGAAALVVAAAYRAGAGTVILAAPKSLEKYYKQIPFEALVFPCPETWVGSLSPRAEKKILEKSKEYDVVVLGPGLSENRATKRLTRRIVLKLKKPLVLDASGLRALKGKTNLFKKREFPTILTPHEGEMGSLCGLTSEEVHKNRQQLAREKAREWGVTVVLKGHETIIASHLLEKLIVNQTGGPSLATAGTGDVLAGILAVLWTENLNKPVEAASAAVFLHGRAGDLASRELGERSVMAGDVIEYLPKALQSLKI